MERFSELCEKIVINICNGQSLGRVNDLAIDWCQGRVIGLIVLFPERPGLFRRQEELCIPLSQITCVGCDTILVELTRLDAHVLAD